MRGLVLACVMALAGCASTAPEPILKYEKVYLNKYVGIKVVIPECQEHAEIPAFPEEGTVDEKAEWAILVGEIRDENRALDQGCIDALTLVLSTVNEHADYVDAGWEPSDGQ